MQRLSLIAVGLIALSACGQSEEQAAPAAPSPAVRVPAVMPKASGSLVDACRQAVKLQYGQAEADIDYDAPTGTVSWRAPVDGGRLTFSCAVQGDRVTLVREGQTQLITLPTSTAGTVEKEAR